MIHFIFCAQRFRTPSRWALEQAKKNVLDKYLVVGLTEEFEQFLQVLERLLPDIFSGLVKVWKKTSKVFFIYLPFSRAFLLLVTKSYLLMFYFVVDSWKDEKIATTQTLNKTAPSPRVREILRNQLKLEYEFYDFVRIHFSLMKRMVGVSS